MASCLRVIVILLPHFNPCSSSGFTAKLSAQVLVKYKCLLPKNPLKNSTDSELACIAAFRNTFLLIIHFFYFGVLCCCPLEVIQLQCMTQGFQIGTTGHPPEWHVLLRTERWDDGILSEILFKMFEYLTVESQILYLTKHRLKKKKVSQNFFYTIISTKNTQMCEHKVLPHPNSLPNLTEQDKGAAEVWSFERLTD